jgi:ubiquinone/menaquinone biosynthesis C-methylase UbiE
MSNTMMVDMKNFDYKSDMKEYYKSSEVASTYHQAFSDQGSWRYRVIANRERQTVEGLLKHLPHETVLDIPTGTGKLAPVFKTLDSTVLACDISENMLRIAESEFDRVGHEQVRFEIGDAEKISNTLDETFDVAVCLRLLHRVPSETKRRILHELGSVAEFVVVSTAVETEFHKLRRWVRRQLLGGDERDHCYESPVFTREILTDNFDVIKSKRILPFVSQERVYLLRPNG